MKKRAVRGLSEAAKAAVLPETMSGLAELASNVGADGPPRPPPRPPNPPPGPAGAPGAPSPAAGAAGPGTAAAAEASALAMSAAIRDSPSRRLGMATEVAPAGTATWVTRTLVMASASGVLEPP